jgi:phage terminase large subunit-like protein
MPVRKRLVVPKPTDDALADLANLAELMGPERLATFAKGLSPEDLNVLEAALGERSAIGWRTTPATLLAQVHRGYQRWRYIDLLADSFTAAVEGTGPTSLLWTMPSQYGKTTLLAQGCVLWLLDRDPTLRVMFVTYDSGKAMEEGGKTRDMAEWHKDKLRFRLRPDRRARGQWATSEGGGLYCTGIKGAITGYPADVLLADDLLKGWAAAHSEAERNLVWDVWRSQLRLRGQGARGVRVVAGTRWHEDDHFARFRNAEDADADADKWHSIRLPAIAERYKADSPDPLNRVPDPLNRAPGEVLEPKRFPLEEVKARAAVLGPYLAAAVEQQRPSPEEGGEIERGWWRWSGAHVAPDAGDWLTSWDTKLKQTDSGDYVVGQVWARVGGTYWLRDQVRGQWPQALAGIAVATLMVRHPHIHRHLLENAGYAPEMVSELRTPRPEYTLSSAHADLLALNPIERVQVEALMRRGLSGLQLINVRGDKRMRLRAVSGLIASGDVVLPENATFAHQLVDEAAAFPNGAHDDMLDSLSQALQALAKGPAKLGTPRRHLGPPVLQTPGSPLRRR